MPGIVRLAVAFAGARALLLDGDGLALSSDGDLVWMAALAAGWLAIGAYAFHRAAQLVRRDGTLTRD